MRWQWVACYCSATYSANAGCSSNRQLRLCKRHRAGNRSFFVLHGDSEYVERGGANSYEPVLVAIVKYWRGIGKFKWRRHSCWCRRRRYSCDIPRRDGFGDHYNRCRRSSPGSNSSTVSLPESIAEPVTITYANTRTKWRNMPGLASPFRQHGRL
jgi:hypothetical protein